LLLTPANGPKLLWQDVVPEGLVGWQWAKSEGANYDF